jgi:hypothetical protein
MATTITSEDNENDARRRGDEPLLSAFEINASWRRIWLRAIARAWRDDDFRQLLVADAEKALGQLGFQIPTYFGDLLDIEVLDYTTNLPLLKAKLIQEGMSPAEAAAQTTPRAYKVLQDVPPPGGGAPIKGVQNGWRDFGKTLRATLHLVLPPPPANPNEFASALADYEAGGRVYPFTFC